MSKAYVITAVDHGETCSGKARTLGVFFDRNEAQKKLDEDMDYYKAMHPTYTEGELAVTDEDGNGCEWNIEGIEVKPPKGEVPKERVKTLDDIKKVNLARLAIEELKLTNLQVCALNGIAHDIAHNNDDYDSYCGLLAKEEDRYLRAVLQRTRGITVEDTETADGEEAR